MEKLKVSANLSKRLVERIDQFGREDRRDRTSAMEILIERGLAVLRGAKPRPKAERSA